MKATKTLQRLVQDFFEQHLVVERNATDNTILAYRDALKLFLTHASQVLGRSADQLDHAVLEPSVVRSFLSWLEQKRGCGPRTRNHRLAVIRSFARYVATVAPEHLERCRAIRQLTPARIEHPEPGYLSEDEVVQLITAAASTSCRDHALLLLLYNTGARVQEIVDLDIVDFHDDAIPYVRLRGKGRKERTCPLWARTVVALRRYLATRTEAKPSEPLFLNAKRRRLSRSGVAYLLRRAVKQARISPQHAQQLSPHVVRHTTAMHLLRSGVDITTIAAWLGHAQLSTTHAYIQIDLRMKQAAVADTLILPELTQGDFPTPDLITWLEAVGRSSLCAEEPAKRRVRPGAREQLHITARSP